jgi:ABC-type multidrug transport system, ATPase component
VLWHFWDPNGAGKTSTIRMIYGFSPLTSGDIFVFGLDIKNYTEKSKPVSAYASRITLLILI